MVDIRTDASRYYIRGDQCFHANEMNKAKLNYLRYAKLNCGNDYQSSFVYCNWACSLYYQHKYQKAIYKFKQAALYNPGLEYIYNGWGSALSNLGKFDEAIEKLNQAIEISPSFSLAHMNIVLALLLKKNEEEALEYFEKIKEKWNFMTERDHMRSRYQREIEMLDLRVSETTDQDEILLIRERKKGVERLIELLSDKENVASMV